MFGVLAFNPFGALIGTNSKGENFMGQHAGRTLKNVNGKLLSSCFKKEDVYLVVIFMFRIVDVYLVVKFMFWIVKSTWTFVWMIYRWGDKWLVGLDVSYSATVGSKWCGVCGSATSPSGFWGTSCEEEHRSSNIFLQTQDTGWCSFGKGKRQKMIILWDNGGHMFRQEGVLNKFIWFIRK